MLGRLITEKVDVATQFLLVSGSGQGGFGLLDRYSPRASYYTYQLYQQFGSELVYAASGVPDVSIYAAKRASGTLTIMLVNLGDGEAKAPLVVGAVCRRPRRRCCCSTHRTQRQGRLPPWPFRPTRR